MPPVFVVHTSEDRTVPIENSMAFVARAARRRVPVESHFYERGPHGFGVRPDLGATSQWPTRLDRMDDGAWMAASTPARQP